MKNDANVEDPRERRVRTVIAPAFFVLFIAVMGVMAWFLVLNPDRVADKFPENDPQTVTPR